MFAGHVGVGLALGSVERRVNAGVFVAAALLLDAILWLLVLLGWESVVIPPDFAATHQPQFVFPWSHGLVASILWSVLAAGLAFFLCADRRSAALLVFAAVFSHWLLDALVHRPELPLAGAGSARVGAGLWDHLALALGVEAALVIAGLGLYLRGAALSRGRSVALGASALVLLLFTVLGMTIAPAPPSPRAMAIGSLATLAATCAWFAWLARAPRGAR